MYDGDRLIDKNNQTWYGDKCPVCEAQNWICNGDENDPSGYDVMSFKCWQCGEIAEIDQEGYSVLPEIKLKWADAVGVRVAPEGCYEEYT